ncbi:hypothetical protein CPB83DRAFT_908890 [Crepidotus variabilis]|uniref:BTB domain-containing protein n=1 Tax=Crepidotus variabilis TaxID=179855 RepID=A0A9P6EAH4_9AGAR|nr:hypothetical protein CPB83DRAFT_908890 [Crepidotus variabilis]
MASPVASAHASLDGGISRHPDYYFTDGSVVLIVESTALRIHQSILGRHSDVFSGMWDVPQPTSMESYDGCPTVVLPDSLDDFVDVVSVLYDPFLHSHFDKLDSQTNLKELISFISGILRISTKYNMQQIRAKCISIIQDKFPSTLAGCDDVLKRKLQYRPSEIDRIIPLARETNVPRVLPWAFYLCAQMAVSELLQNAALSWKDKALCLAGKERLWEMQKTVTHTFLLNFQNSPQCITGCKVRSPDTFKAAMDAIEVLRLTPHALEEYTDWPGLRLCIKCQIYVQTLHREGREKVWQLLPTFFHLGTWDEIFKDQSC